MIAKFDDNTGPKFLFYGRIRCLGADDEDEIEIARYLSETVKWLIERDGPIINKSLSGANQTGAKYPYVLESVIVLRGSTVVVHRRKSLNFD